MRDIFDDIFARTSRSTRPRRRGAACARNCDGGSTRDVERRRRRGRLSRAARRPAGATPARRPLAAPARRARRGARCGMARPGRVIDPATMPLTRLANSIIDGVADAPGPVAAEIEKYLGTDLLFYRAGGRRAWSRARPRHWDPLIDWARDGARRALRAGRRRGHVAQPRAGAGRGARGLPMRATQTLAARRAACDHDADRLGPARARAPARAASAPTRPGPPRMSTRTGTWTVGPRRAGARAPRLPLRRDAGGGDGARRSAALRRAAIPARSRAMRAGNDALNDCASALGTSSAGSGRP